ncbi:SpaA isopeptide-forming pilin-related protein [Lacticaseibacillus sp. 53-4]|uniref:SpaA isopeptide-forming pilin-related protein n=1 Tax=Lacticaseibacillus sp. 53-4 TaxID=2799575 RepID=UPI001943A523|nr:SpaA isopeptide-forming pilin-related protein [Lacticaseibacillus sp. 53-4]
MMKWIKQVIKHTHSRRFTRVAGALLVALVAVQLVPTPAKSVTADDSGTPPATDTTAVANKVTATNPTGSGYFDDKINAGTQNDVLYEAQRFALFGETVDVGSVNLDGNVAAENPSGSTNLGTQTIKPPLPKDGDKSVDLFYFDKLLSPDLATKFTSTNLDSERIITGEDPTAFNFPNNDKTTVKPDPNYIHIGKTLDELKGLSEFYASRSYQFNELSVAQMVSRGLIGPQDSDDKTPEDTGVRAFDMSDMNLTSVNQSDQKYEKTYSLRIQKTDSAGNALGGAMFELQFPTFPENKSEVRYDSNGYAIPTGWTNIFDVLNGKGSLPKLYGWDANTTSDDLSRLNADKPTTGEERTADQLKDGEAEQPGNPQYDASGQLVTTKDDDQVHLYDRNHNLISTEAEYLKAMTTLQASSDTPAAEANSIETGTINVSLNYPGRYRFYEIQAPTDYSIDPQTTTEVDSVATNVSPEAKMLTIPWTALYTNPYGGNQSVSGLYLLNVSFDNDATPIIINVDFKGAKDSIKADVNAPNVYLLPTNASGDNDTKVDLSQEIKFDSENGKFIQDHSNKILWNFFDSSKTDGTNARSINVANDNLPGTILAPTSTISVNGGHIYGSIIANTINVGTGTIHRWDFDYQLWSTNNNKTVTNRQQSTIHVVVKKKWSDLPDGTPVDKLHTPVKVQLYRRAIPVPDTADGASGTVEKLPDPTPVGPETTLSGDSKDPWTADLGYHDTTVEKQPVAYFVKETSGPGAGYTATYDYEYKDDPASTDANNPITLQQVTVSNALHGFDISKVAAGTDNLLAGATYHVSHYLDTDKKWVVDQKSDDIVSKVPSKDDATKAIVPMEPGIYLIQEAKSPAGYKQDNTIYALKLTLSNGETVENGWLKPTTDSTPHFSWLTTPITSTNMTEAEEEANEAQKWDPIPDTPPQSGFYNPGGRPNLVHFQQEDKLKPLKVIKVDADDTDQLLSGAEFQIGKVDDSGKRTGNDPVTYRTDSNGQIGTVKGDNDVTPTTVTMKPDATYAIKEVTPPKDHELNGTIVYLKNGKIAGGVDAAGQPLAADADALKAFGVTYSDDATQLKFPDKPVATGKIIIRKVDESNHFLSGATFELKDGAKPAATLSPTDKDGAISTAYPAGTKVTVTEKTAPGGYQQLTGSAEVTFDADGQPAVKRTGDFQDNVTPTIDSNSHLVVLTVKNTPYSILPHTGGPGDREYLVFALCMLGIAVPQFTIQVQHPDD